MFLNYSALESGKLVLQLRENDLRDCINDLTCRWQDAFQRAKVRLDIKIHPDLPLFKFDYQKVQQCMANLLDNALKHTPADGCVTLVARAAFLGTAHFGSSSFRRTAAATLRSSPTAFWFPSPTRAAESRPSFIRRFSKSLCAWTLPLREWVWVWRLRSA